MQAVERVILKKINIKTNIETLTWGPSDVEIIWADCVVTKLGVDKMH